MTLLPRYRILLVFALLLISGTTAAAGDDDWRPITAEELAMKSPLVEPEADAEAIFWEVRVDDSGRDLASNNYVRIKIFTVRGREMFSKYDIHFFKGVSIKDVGARVTHPNGSTFFLKNEDIFEREIIKAGGFKIKAKSFAVPGIEVGSILEFRYREVNPYGMSSMPLIMQRDIPVQKMSYYVKPFWGRRAMYAHPFNVGDAWFENEKNDFKRVTMNNVPAFKREPDMLPDDEVRGWIHLYYSLEPSLKKPEEYWKRINRFYFDYGKDRLKPGDEVKQITAEVTTGAATDDEKLKRIYEFVQGKIRNLHAETGVNDADWKRVEGEKSPADTLKLKIGSAEQIEFLFGSMVRAAGLDARAAYTGNRRELLCNQGIPNAELMLRTFFMAVKSGDEWRFFSPSSFDVPYGMINWVLEGQMAMITDPKEPVWVEVGLAAPERSTAKRSGTFQLQADGTLTGEGKVEFTGHSAVYHKALNRGGTSADQEVRLRDFVKNTISETAEITSFNIENLDSGNKPFTYTFKLTVPNYAVKTGKRLFFQPGVFERRSRPRFIAGVRKTDIYFSYPWMETDNFTIELPAGFSMEAAEAPGVVTDKAGIGRDEVGITVSGDGKALRYQRKFSFGKGGAVRFGPESYPVLKDMFNSYNRVDTHQLTLRENTPTAN